LPNHAKPTIIMKPDCPWRVRTPKGISMLQLPMFWHFNPIFTVAPGIIWTDIHHEINQQMLFHRYGEFIIKRGTPLAMYVPYERKKYDYEISGPNAENSRWANISYTHIRTKFKGGYKLHQAEVKKCPMGHKPKKQTIDDTKKIKRKPRKKKV